MTDSELDDLVLAGTRVLGLPIEAAWKPAIRAHLEMSLQLAARIVEFDLPDEIEPAPVFQAARARR